jgi:hypothetical protein
MPIIFIQLHFFIPQTLQSGDMKMEQKNVRVKMQVVSKTTKQRVGSIPTCSNKVIDK